MTITDLQLSGMTCSSCAARIERGLNGLDGVAATVNFAVEQAHVEHAPSVGTEDLIRAVASTGYRASVIDQMRQDYVMTARAKGQTERGITFGHVTRNALLPVLTMAGVQAGNLIGGSVITEAVFGWPGLGTLAFSALQGRDLNLLLGIFLMSACLVVVLNLLVDLAYAALDPRLEA